MSRRSARDISVIFGKEGSLFSEGEEISNVESRILKKFENHPFFYKDKAKMQKLVDSIQETNVLEPIIVHKEGTELTILAGHHRNEANILAGNQMIPAIIKTGLSYVEQVRIVNHSNFYQRGLNDFTYCEKAKAFKLEYDALLMDRKDDDSKFQNGQKTREYLAQLYNVDDSTMRRYLDLNKLINEFQELLDEGSIKFSVAVEFASLDDAQQFKLYRFIMEKEIKPVVKNSKSLIQMAKDDDFDINTLNEKLDDNKKIKIEVERCIIDLIPEELKKKDMIQKSVQFAQIELPRMLTENGIQLDTNHYYEHLLCLIEKCIALHPELLKR